MPSNRKLLGLLMVVAMLGLFTGCGQKGPLVMPDRPAKPKAEPAAPATDTTPAPAPQPQSPDA